MTATAEIDISALEEKIAKQHREITSLQEQLAWFKRQIFGKRSERVVSDLNHQQLMFEGFENPQAQKKRKKQRSLLMRGENPIAMAKTKSFFLPICQLKQLF